MRYLTRTKIGWLLDHHLTPEVRAMLAAMASRAPAGGIEARYREVVGAVRASLASELHDHSQHGAAHILKFEDAEERLTVYPLHPKVQEFFDKFVGKYGHCYDKETEVLCKTKNGIGWMAWESAYSSEGVALAAYVPEADGIRFEEPSSWVKKHYAGKMYKVKKVRGNVNLLVTPEHRMYVSRKVGRSVDGKYKQTWGEFSVHRADDIALKTMTRYKRVASRLYRDAASPFNTDNDPWGFHKINTVAFGRLCGFFVGDGYAGGKQAGYLSSHMTRDRKKQYLSKIVEDLGIPMRRNKNGKFHLHLPGARDWARKQFYADDGKKKIPSWVLLASRSFQEGFVSGLKNSDGSPNTEQSWSYASNSLKVIEGLQILGLWLCLPVSFSGPNSQGIYTAFVSGPRHAEPVINQSHRDDSWAYYEGDVFCATVSTGLLVVRRGGAPIISGNSSVQELVGGPTVYVEGVSPWTAYLSFDNPLVMGQEFSTRAVRRKDWPICREADGDEELEALHKEWLEIFDAEVAAWRGERSKPCLHCEGAGTLNLTPTGIYDQSMPATCPHCKGTGKKHVDYDPQGAFRWALDKARWALPSTIATGFCHTANTRVMGRVIQQGLDFSRVHVTCPGCAGHGFTDEYPAPPCKTCDSLGRHFKESQTWLDIKEAYEQALPGMAGMWFREAVASTRRNVPTHLDLSEGGMHKEVTVRVHRLDSPEIPARSHRGYLDPSWNQLVRVDIRFMCSWAVARDWHRHRTGAPWRLGVVYENDSFVMHKRYTPLSDAGKEAPWRGAWKSYGEFLDSGDREKAMLCIPFGATVSMSTSMGLRDAVYMLELRAYTRGANPEYRAQALEALRQLKVELGDLADEIFPESDQ